MSDVNVTEKVARAVHAAVVTDLTGRGEDPSEAADWIEWLGEADAALAALADPEVLAGIAGVHYAAQVMADHTATAVVEWLRGRAL